MFENFHQSMKIALAFFGAAVFITSSAGGDAIDERWIALGARLFADGRFSADGTVSCASCHRPEHAYADARVTGIGISQHPGTRNVPSLTDVSRYATLNWDGRTGSLEEQVLQPFTTTVEHGLVSRDDLVRRVRAQEGYRPEFRALSGVDGGEIDGSAIAQALSAFIRSLSRETSAFDRYRAGRDVEGLSESARRGFEFFVGRGQCATCHVVTDAEAPLTDNRFHVSGVGLPDIGGRLGAVLTRLDRLGARLEPNDILSDPDIAALGRYVVTRKPEDIGAFRTPSLRNVARTAPYFHDGSVPTLEAAVDLELYDRRRADGLPVVLSRSERDDLLEFLRALNDP